MSEKMPNLPDPMETTYGPLYAPQQAASELAPARGSVNPLTKQEQTQLDAVIVLLRRGEIAISRRILCQPTEDKTLVADLRAYIEAHSPNAALSEAAGKETPK